ncbi:hypothetical protein GeomeDRAFT_2103 [Geobacter metallireducens RCH3]|uniref:Uncharacterized protein n=1 Tax=Geobacter metallireducens (strain ATCC 53774 / DSM 7210 / GS-15) TaxID=269799 RepID=Q39SK4_GEOMG|nr:hypothetical protein [Geobacter metallireducens]ABB32770.1 hypothetical protein Gmet_2551 [Geobacter metallireducens GS-15]EHP86120.1 hypothetical protein GeomeDRAFT_2103 [Geobacter metallireducens RCH3]
MFGLFRKKVGEPIEFGSTDAAFDYACRNLENRILLEAVIPALVEERRGMSPEGEQLFFIRLANREGGKVIEACTLKESLRHPAVGDLVGYRVVKVEPELPEPFDLLGFIACRLQPVYVPGRGWRIAESFVPDNIKPTLRM